ncbi:MAG: hypothetical protein IPL61_09495 [Myxococcales bacterium]|nr:hypothetical protein [Myxococcales bacterium]
MEQLIDWGSPCPTQDADALRSDRARRVLGAVQAHRAYELIELRHLERQTLGPCDVIVVTCTNQEIPNRNAVGIRVREPLALTIPVDETGAPEVRALRPTFPLVPHLNGVGDGEPKSLCVTVEAWSAARRTWTPQHFLNLTLWWLKDTALGRLHRLTSPSSGSTSIWAGSSCRHPDATGRSRPARGSTSATSSARTAARSSRPTRPAWT